MKPPDPLRPSLISYVYALICVASATGVGLLLEPLLGSEHPYYLPYLAVIVTAWYLGLGPSILALGVGALATDYLFQFPRGEFGLGSWQQVVTLSGFLLTSALIAILSRAKHVSQRKAVDAAELLRLKALQLDASHAKLEQRVLERTSELTQANARLLQSQDQLQISEARFRSYVESAPIGILVADGAKKFTEANRVASRLLGYRIDELRGLPVETIHPAEELASVHDAFSTLDETGTTDGIFRLLRRDGTIFWTSMRAVVLPEGRTMAFFRDISEEKRISDELRIERDWFAKVVSTVPVVICSFRQRPDGKWSSPFPNPGLEAIYGISPALLADDASAMFARMHPGDVARVSESIFESARTMTPWHCEFRVNNPYRGEIWVEGQSIPTTEPDGSILWHGYIADVTARKQTEEALRNSESRLRLMVEGISDYALFMLDANGHVLNWHRGAEQVYGYRDTEIVGRPYSLLFPPQGVATDKSRQELAEASANGRCDVEGWRVRKSGTQFWVTGTIGALYDAEGVVIGYAKVTRDITAKRRNDELLYSILDHTLDAIITVDDRGTVSTINAGGERIFGYRFSEVVDRNIKTLMPDSLRENHDRPIGNDLAAAEANLIGIGREVQGRRKDGSRFPMDLAVTEFRLDDQRHFVVIVRDVSEKKRLEAQLFQSQKMEAFGQLAGGVAHDFNNLLTLINGYSQILQRMVPAKDSKQKMLGQIFRAGQRAASLTQQLLAFSRQQVLEPKVLDINSIVLDSEIMLRRLIGEDIELSTVLYPHLSAVKADPGQVEQVIMNLAVNARDAMPLGGKLTIETSEGELGPTASAQLAALEPGRYVTISISDTGTGMPPEVGSRVFEPFFTTKGVGKGTGLGLAVAHGIVKQSGGAIDLYSEEGVGTTFKVRLPAIGASVTSTVETGPAPSTDGTETVLLVEDDENVREFIALSLESFGYTVLTAPDGKAALSFYQNRKSPIDLVVTDVVMPEMSGRVLAETLIAKHPGLKVLFVSGYTDDAVVRHGILQADVAFLQKPFTPEALGRKVREVIDQA